MPAKKRGLVRKMQIDGYDINYKISGEGPETAVILQGWGTSLDVYDTVAQAIREKYRVVQFDFPGFGGSDEPREAWDVDAYADFFCKLMEELGIGRAALIGHSYGGRVILKLASRENIPFEITKIALIDSAGIVPEKTAAQKLRVWKYKAVKAVFHTRWFKALFPAMVEEWSGRQGSQDYRNATPIMRQCLVKAVNEDLTHLLGSVRQETLLIWGDLDTATPLGDGKKMEELMPNAGLVVLEGAGHYSFLEKPAEFRNVMRSYFQIGASE